MEINQLASCLEIMTSYAWKLCLVGERNLGLGSVLLAWTESSVLPGLKEKPPCSVLLVVGRNVCKSSSQL
jgi:hypothetical protein